MTLFLAQSLSNTWRNIAEMALVAIAGLCTGVYLVSNLYLKKKQQESRTREETQNGPVFNSRNQLAGPPGSIKSTRYIGPGQFGIPKWEVTFMDGKKEYKYSKIDPHALLTT